MGFILAIPLVALRTVESTVKEVTSKNYEMLVLTGLDNTRIAYGLLFCGFYRARIFLFFLLAVTPVQIIGLTFTGYIEESKAFYTCPQNQFYTNAECAEKYPSPYPPLRNTIGSLVTATCLLAGGWAFLFLCSSVGLTLGLWWRHAVAAGLGTTFVVLWAGLLLLATGFDMRGGFSNLALITGLSLGWLWRKLLVAVVLGVLFSLTFGCLIMAFPPTHSVMIAIQIVVVPVFFYTAFLLIMKFAQTFIRKI
jgi:hypothetical protein